MSVPSDVPPSSYPPDNGVAGLPLDGSQRLQERVAFLLREIDELVTGDAAALLSDEGDAGA